VRRAQQADKHGDGFRAEDDVAEEVISAAGEPRSADESAGCKRPGVVVQVVYDGVREFPGELGRRARRIGGHDERRRGAGEVGGGNRHGRNS
jgi:hypothetical protein